MRKYPVLQDRVDIRKIPTLMSFIASTLSILFILVSPYILPRNLLGFIIAIIVSILSVFLSVTIPFHLRERRISQNLRRKHARFIHYRIINNDYPCTLSERCYMTLYINKKVEDIKKLPPFVYNQYVSFIESIEHVPKEELKKELREFDDY